MRVAVVVAVYIIASLSVLVGLGIWFNWPLWRDPRFDHDGADWDAEESGDGEDDDDAA